MNSDDDVLAALAAVGALDDEEMTVFEQRLATDPDLAAEYLKAQESAAVLVDVVSEPPPAHLRASVLAAIATTQQESASPDAIDSTPPRLAVVAPADTVAAPHNVVDINSRSARRRRWMLPATAAAAVVLLVGGALILKPGADAPNDPIAAVLADDGAQHIALAGDVNGLTVVRSVDRNASAIIGDDIDVDGLTSDEVLQLWAVRDGVMSSMGTFTPDEDGRIAVVMDGLVEPEDAAYAVTIEPAGGSDQPTTAPIAES